MKEKKKKLSEEDYLELFFQKHGNKFQYLPFPEKINFNTPIKIICPKHGEFTLSIGIHKRGQGCPKCYDPVSRIRKHCYKPLGRAVWLKRFESVHGYDKYGYDKVPEDITITSKVEIYCMKHNSYFTMSVNDHYHGRGCPTCGNKKQGITRKQRLITRRDFERKARLVHGEKFEYSELPMEFSLYDTIMLFCNEHNHIFYCNAGEHLIGKGCPETSKLKI